MRRVVILTFLLALNFSFSLEGQAQTIHLNILNQTGRKIYKATLSNDISKVRELLSRKEYDNFELMHKTNYKDSRNRTALIISAIYGYHDIATLLMQNGANPAWKDISGLTAEDYAYRRGDVKMKEIVRISGGQRVGDFSPLGFSGERRLAPKIRIYNDGSFSWRNCQNYKDFGGHTIPFQRVKKRLVFIPECAPDILYSWKKGDKFTQKIKDPNSFFEINPLKGLYTWRTPLGTFGYGDLPLRIKLRPHVRFVLLDNSMRKRSCQTFSKEEKEKTVYVSYIKEINAAEYLLCDSGPIESWSAGIPELVTEIKKEKNYAESLFGISGTHNAIYSDEIENYLKRNRELDVPRHVNNNYAYWGFIVDQGTNWSKAYLNRLLANLELNELNRRDYIKYAPDVIPNRENHLQSKYYSYFSYTRF